MDIIKKDYFSKKYYLKGDAQFPNNETRPIILYKRILNLPLILPGRSVKRLFKRNNWLNAWRGGIYNYHHYHSNTYEVLGVYKGKTTIQLGGDEGVSLIIGRGDVLIIPAGVAHKNLKSGNTIKCVGAYPNGKKFDMNYGLDEERPKADENILKTPLPSSDPVLGFISEVENYWK